MDSLGFLGSICITVFVPLYDIVGIFDRLGVVHNCHHFHERTQRTVKPLCSDQSRDPKKCSLYGGVHPRGVRYVHAHMCQKYNVPVHMYIKTDLPNLFDL